MRSKLAPIAFAMGLAVIASAQTGCSTMSNTEKGVGLGAVGGTVIGTVIGAATGNPKTGAVIGGLAGAGVGGLIGDDIDHTEKKKKDRQEIAAAAAYSDAQPTRIDEVVQMVKNGQSDRVVINHIRQNRMRFVMNANDLNYLKQCNVPDTVIVEMQNGSPPVVAAPRPVIIREQVIVREPIYYVPPPPVMYVEPGLSMHFRR